MSNLFSDFDLVILKSNNFDCSIRVYPIFFKAWLDFGNRF